MADLVKVNKANPFAANDYNLIINSFEKDTADYPVEEYVLVSHYKDVYSTRNFSERVQEQMNYYPGMHQSSDVPRTDPAYITAGSMANDRLRYWDTAIDNPEAFMDGVYSQSPAIDYGAIFGKGSSSQRKEELAKLFTQCIPCFGRLMDPDGLLPDMTLLQIHLGNIGIRSDLLDQFKDLINGPGFYIDICELLKYLSGLCPQDLLAMLILLTQYLARLNLDFKFNIDFIVNLVGAILSPFLDSLSQWLDKWIQMIIAPMLCVVDHLNETIIMAQQAKIPLSEATGSIDANVGDFHGFTQVNRNPDGTTGGIAEADYTFDEHYSAKRPDLPDEETKLAESEIAESWHPTLSEAERQERNQQWDELKQKNAEQHTPNYAPAETVSRTHTFGEYYPPEKQGYVKPGNWYIDISPLTNSLTQMRNILQGAIQYVNDWFTYVTQMIYDLLGTDFGWMNNKTNTSKNKIKIIQLIALIKSILEAVSKNGLECGVESNFDVAQMRYVFENSINKFTNTQFRVLDSGEIEIVPPDSTGNNASVVDTSTTESIEAAGDNISAGEGIGNIPIAPESSTQQKPVKSGIIIRSCLDKLPADQLEEARKWIESYERS